MLLYALKKIKYLLLLHLSYCYVIFMVASKNDEIYFCEINHLKKLYSYFL